MIKPSLYYTTILKKYLQSIFTVVTTRSTPTLTLFATRKSGHIVSKTSIYGCRLLTRPFPFTDKGKLPTDTEKTTIVSVTDRCADDSCQVGNLDFSKVAFEDLADLGVGRLEGVTWEWV